MVSSIPVDRLQCVDRCCLKLLALTLRPDFLSIKFSSESKVHGISLLASVSRSEKSKLDF